MTTIGFVQHTDKQEKAKRFNSDKPQLSYMLDFPNAMVQLAKLCEFGASKYGRDNWKLGRSSKDTLDSLMRHILLYANGEDMDEESNLPHLAHIIWNAAALIEWKYTHPEMDDRGFEE